MDLPIGCRLSIDKKFGYIEFARREDYRRVTHIYLKKRLAMEG